MMRPRRNTLIATALVSLMAAPASGERLALHFLPPDLPASNVCNVTTEAFDDEETQIGDATEANGSGGETLLENDDRIGFLMRDIRSLRRHEPVVALDYIHTLIDKRAEIDPDFTETEIAFERISTFLAAGQIGALEDSGLIEALNEQVEDLDWSDTVRLARFYLNGIGVVADRAYATELIVNQAYLGNAEALLEVVRLLLRGDDVQDWTLSVEETARLAFGGLIGKTNRGVCNRAERMAREYLDGDILVPNPDLAYAWRKFAANQGGGSAAWRIVEHLSLIHI